MKRLLAVALCAFIVFAPTHQPARAQTPIMFVLGSAILGGVFIIYITYRTAPSGGVHKFVLLKSYDCVNWTPVSTNTLRMPLGQPMPTFASQKRESSAFYWVREVSVNQNFCIERSSKEWAIAQ